MDKEAARIRARYIAGWFAFGLFSALLAFVCAYTWVKGDALLDLINIMLGALIGWIGAMIVFHFKEREDDAK